MRILIGAVGLALLAGCASMEEKRANGPAHAYSSRQTASAVAECVLYAWQNQSLAGSHIDASIQPLRDGGKTVISAGQVEFADFKDVPSGSKVELYFQSGLMSWRKNRRTDAVESCL